MEQLAQILLQDNFLRRIERLKCWAVVPIVVLQGRDKDVEATSDTEVEKLRETS